MARIAGVDLKDDWKIDYALTKIKGIGWSLSEEILEDTKIDKDKKVSKLTNDEISKLGAQVEEHPIEGELTRIVRQNINRLKQVGAYRGIRHARNLPVRGQRTKTNARTKRGKRKTVGAFKKEDMAKGSTAKKEE